MVGYGGTTTSTPNFHTATFDFVSHPFGVAVRRLEDDGPLRDAGLHECRFVSLLLITDGMGEHRQGPSTWQVEHGDLFVIAPGEPLDAGGLRNAAGWSMQLVPSAVGGGGQANSLRLPHPGDPAWIIAVRVACLQHRHHISGVELSRWQERFEHLELELAQDRHGQQAAVSALATLIIVALGRVALPAVQDAAPIQHRIVEETFRYIEEHFEKSISLDDVAHALSRSSGSLARVMRQLTGKSVNAWILERRMTEARRLLLATSDSVQQIGFQVGYTDPNYFRDRFKDVHSIAPHAWRTLRRLPA